MAQRCTAAYSPASTGGRSRQSASFALGASRTCDRGKMMKVVRVIARILVLGPMGALVGYLVGKTKACRLIGPSEREAGARELANAIGIALISMAMGTLCFVVGLTGHFLIVRRSQVYARYARYLILAGSIIFLPRLSLGTVLGGVTMVLLFTLPTFSGG